MPYIPQKHEKYNLLPFCRQNGGEVFEYPYNLYDINKMLPDGVSLYPYGYDSYQAYYSYLDKIAEEYGTEQGTQNEIYEKINSLKQKIQELNIKDNWVVLQYVGDDTPGFNGLTKGQYYYAPVIDGKPGHSIGVIDDEEFTSYLYSGAPDLWVIAEDPFGMAKDFFKTHG